MKLNSMMENIGKSGVESIYVNHVTNATVFLAVSG